MDQAQNARRNLDFAARAIDLAETRRDLSETGCADTATKFKLGSVSQDVLNASVDSTNQNDYGSDSARADFLAAWSDFVSLVGADPAMNNLPARYVRPVR